MTWKSEEEKLDWIRAKLYTLPDDTVITLGDYVDRGPDSKGVSNACSDSRDARALFRSSAITTR